MQSTGYPTVNHKSFGGKSVYYVQLLWFYLRSIVKNCFEKIQTRISTINGEIDYKMFKKDFDSIK
tara:strand:+ start:994 stop:1188 length:195 start_codon:yes stop_codon:yes gene_type:complete